MTKYTLKSLNDLPKTAGQILSDFKNEKIFALFGKMGSGKTTLIKEICRQMNVVDNVTSPTFSVVNEYRTENGEVLYHFDFYRIENIEEVFDLGYEDYFYGGSVCFAEWPELIETLLPENYVKIEIEETENGARHISCIKVNR